MKKIFLSLLILSSMTSFALEKIYLDEDEFKSGQDAFYVHLGHNVWMPTHCVHRDETGLFTFDCNLMRSGTDLHCSYQKTWKCPYCYHYWPIGTACQNKDCPSKYKISIK